MDRETVEEIKRHFGVIAQDLRGGIRAVAEGQQGTRRGMDSFRADVERRFEETLSLIRLSHGELGRRVRSLEAESAELGTRLERVEDRLAS